MILPTPLTFNNNGLPSIVCRSMFSSSFYETSFVAYEGQTYQVNYPRNGMPSVCAHGDLLIQPATQIWLLMMPARSVSL